MNKTVITIARSYGSGGRTMGKLLAERLGIQFYDREILRIASDESGISEELFGQVDEKLKKSPLIGIVRKNPYKGAVIGPENSDFVSDDNLFNYQAKVIKELAAQESCVIMGRCADYVLRDDPDVIRLYLYAPLPDCIKRVMAQNGLNEKDAAKKIEKVDKYRADYYHYYTGRNWNDARNYNFCLDTTSMSYDKLVEVVQNFINTYQKDE
jgi:cytidylate kinase